MDSPVLDASAPPSALSLRRATSASKRSAAVSGGGSKRGSSTRVSELELDHEGALAVSVSGSSGFAPGAALAQGLRRIHSSPSMQAAAAAAAAAVASSATGSAAGSKAGSQSSSRKKGAGTASGAASGDMKNVAATKAARRLARKAEAARQSRRRKKAALGDMEETLNMLEARHAELLKQQKAGGKAGAGAGAGAASNSKNAAAVAAARLRAAAASSHPTSPAPSSDSPRSHPARHDADGSSHLGTAADSYAAASPAPAMPASLAHRFSAVLSSLSRHRHEEVREKMDFLQRHTAPDARGGSALSDFLTWILSRGHKPGDPDAGPTMTAAATAGGSSQPPALPPLSDFAAPSCLPPAPLAGVTTEDARSLWLDLFRGGLGLSGPSYAALQGPRLHGAVLSLLDSRTDLHGALSRLSDQLALHLESRATHNASSLFGLFTPRQQEILAQTAFKQQQQAAQAQAATAQKAQQAMQQQQQQQQQLQPQSHSPRLSPRGYSPQQHQQQQHVHHPAPQLFPRSVSPQHSQQQHPQQHSQQQQASPHSHLRQFPAPRAGPSYVASMQQPQSAPSQSPPPQPQQQSQQYGFPPQQLQQQLHLSPRMQAPSHLPAGLAPPRALHVPQQQLPPSPRSHPLHPSQLPTLFLPVHPVSPESPMHATSERMLAYSDPGEHSAYHGQ